MGKFTYSRLTVLGIVLTVVFAVYAYCDRGYFAVGGEYCFLLLPLFGAVIEGEVEDRLDGRYG